MSVLIVENNPVLGSLWCRHIQRQGRLCQLVCSQSAAIEALRTTNIRVVIVNLRLEDGSTLALTDYISYRYPNIKVIAVTSDGFFSDGSVFNVISNASAMVQQETTPEDLDALVEYHGG